METNFTPSQECSNGTENLGQAILNALVYFFKMLFFILILCPFAFWKGAVARLSKASAHSLISFVGQSRWPFLSFLKKILFDYAFDGGIFICYFLGVIGAFYVLFDSGSVRAFIGVLVIAYYYPLLISVLRDVFMLLILPFSKFLSWVSKPAQQIDVDFHNHTEK